MGDNCACTQRYCGSQKRKWKITSVGIHINVEIKPVT